MFANLMSELQNKVSLSFDQMIAIKTANDISRETVNCIADCVNGLVDFDQFIASIVFILKSAK